MKILYIGETTTYRQYLDGNVPSHWFYGAYEMEREGHEVIWAQESLNIYNDIKLINKYSPDIIFVPNLNIHNHLLLLTFAHIINIPIFAFLHHEPQAKAGVKSKLYKFLLGGVKHLFFLSEKTMRETVNSGLVDENRCYVPNWGPDMDFYSKVETEDKGCFVSTGKENRDFDILIEAFRRTQAPLHIITAMTHNGADYTDLEYRCRNIPNIKVTIVENSPDNYPMMLREMASAKALVCPLRKDKLNYCVGLSTIADAEGLNKPLIITNNPYHDNRPEEDGFYTVDTVDDWVRAINEVQKKAIIQSKYSMNTAYQKMKKK